MKYLDDLLFWVNERERIRKLKITGANPPWTSDPVLSTYRFCNVRREDDRVTKWIHDNWLRPNMNHPHLAFAMGVARMVNLPETLAEVGFPEVWLPKLFEDTLYCRKLRGDKVWTSAYMITGGYSKGGESKEVIIARVLDALYAQLNTTHGFIARGDSLEVAAEKVRVPGIGSFLSGQIVADLKWSTLLWNCKDWKYWCTPGPGSTMGLNFLHDRENRAIGERQFIDEVNEVRELIRHSGFDLCAQNTQNCLCEFSKYVRAKHYGQRLKSTYKPYLG